MNPNKQEAAPLERDGLKENCIEQAKDSTKGEWCITHAPGSKCNPRKKLDEPIKEMDR